MNEYSITAIIWLCPSMIAFVHILNYCDTWLQVFFVTVLLLNSNNVTHYICRYKDTTSMYQQSIHSSRPPAKPEVHYLVPDIEVRFMLQDHQTGLESKTEDGMFDDQM